MTRRLTLAQARRAAVAAQGLDRTRPTGVVTMAHLQRVVDRIGLLQIDSVNVVARAHLLPLYSRLGPYPTALLDRAAGDHPRRLVEYWAHEASFVPPRTYRLLHWRMADRSRRAYHPGLGAQPQAILEAVRAHIQARGAATARAVEAALGSPDGRSRDHWGWNWSATKHAVERLFATGELAVAGRTPSFERIYDLPERVLPPLEPGDVVPSDRSEALVELVEIAARAHGVATVGCLRDYFRTGAAETARAVETLVSRGRLEEVTIQGVDRHSYLHVEARLPRRTRARALLAPFDPVVFERRRLAELFGMHYRIGIYTPAAQRTHGYYVLPFFLGEHAVARVDVRADRAAGVLEVRHVFAEDPHDVPGLPSQDAWPSKAEVARHLADELGVMAGWLGLSSVCLSSEVAGDLVRELSVELRRARSLSESHG